MKLMTTIHAERREAERQQVAVGVMIGSAADHEAAVLMENLSVDGFQMIAAVPLAVGQTIAVVLPHSGERCATIVWHRGVRYGCAFTIPLMGEDLAQVVAAQEEVDSLRRQRAISGWLPGAKTIAA